MIILENVSANCSSPFIIVAEQANDKWHIGRHNNNEDDNTMLQIHN